MNENTPQPTEIGRRYGIGLCSRKFIISLVDPETVQAIVTALGEWEELRKKFEDTTHPLNAVARLKEEIGRCNCPIELPKLSARLVAAQGQDYHTTYAACGTVNKFRSEKMDALLHEFFQQVSQNLLARIVEVTELESKFLAQFGLPEESTTARKKLLSISRELTGMSKLDEMHPTLASLSHGTVQAPNRARWIAEGCAS